ncbi:hypothetical protein O9993_05150 [Vibrio lentus]|nr:hypothetical protein [Vibrio lentus]
MVPHKRVSQSGELSEEAASSCWPLVPLQSIGVCTTRSLSKTSLTPEVIWYRNEVELKKCGFGTTSASPASAFAGLCDFGQYRP